MSTYRSPDTSSYRKVGKNVSVKIWRNKKSINKRLVLGRLESSKEFIAENKPAKKNKEVEDTLQWMGHNKESF